jgi:RNA polymerase sigma-54 factor
MKQGLSLRVSQQLTLTPALQQSIRLLQLSTLELSSEVDQMLDDNPFLERADDTAEREQFGVDQADTPVSQGDAIAEVTGAEAGDTFDDAYASADPEHRDDRTDAADFSVNGDEFASFDTPLAAPTSEAGVEAASDASTPDWDGDGTVEIAPNDSEWGSDAPASPSKGSGDGEATAQDLASAAVSLQDHLHQQALGLRLSDEDKAALYMLIESLDEDGYLADSLSDLAHSLAGDDWAAHDDFVVLFEDALEHLQAMEPIGVGARDLTECLRLQIEDLRNTPVAQAALAIVAQPLELLAKRDVKRLSQVCDVADELVRQAIVLIQRLEPKPGRRFIQTERNVVVPDVIVTRAGDGFKVSLNPNVMPRLQVSDMYASALKSSKAADRAADRAAEKASDKTAAQAGDEATAGASASTTAPPADKASDKADDANAMQQRLQEARWFIKNIQQRFETILRVSSAIVERQQAFFIHGELAMKPMVLREIADELGLHESTISRVTTAKYMATPQGTFELKYFFGSGLGTESGANTSSTAVRALIKQFIAAETPKKPLSDNQLSVLLRDSGIECARRTVAKYREAMRIAPANLRKAL